MQNSRRRVTRVPQLRSVLLVLDKVGWEGILLCSGSLFVRTHPDCTQPPTAVTQEAMISPTLQPSSSLRAFYGKGQGCRQPTAANFRPTPNMTKLRGISHHLVSWNTLQREGNVLKLIFLSRRHAGAQESVHLYQCRFPGSKPQTMFVYNVTRNFLWAPT